MILLNTHTRNLDIFMDIESSVLKRLLGTRHRATINCHNDFTRLCRFNHSTHMASDSSEAEKLPYALLSQFNARLIGNLSDIRSSGTWKNGNFTWLT